MEHCAGTYPQTGTGPWHACSGMAMTLNSLIPGTSPGNQITIAFQRKEKTRRAEKNIFLMREECRAGVTTLWSNLQPDDDPHILLLPAIMTPPSLALGYTLWIFLCLTLNPPFPLKIPFSRLMRLLLINWQLILTNDGQYNMNKLLSSTAELALCLIKSGWG